MLSYSIWFGNSIKEEVTSSPVKLGAHVNGHALELAQHAAEVIEGVVLLLLLDLQDSQINRA
jgi:hypothetical protein